MPVGCRVSTLLLSYGVWVGCSLHELLQFANRVRGTAAGIELLRGKSICASMSSRVVALSVICCLVLVCYCALMLNWCVATEMLHDILKGEEGWQFVQALQHRVDRSLTSSRIRPND